MGVVFSLVQVGSEDIDEAMAMVYANRGDCYQVCFHASGSIFTIVWQLLGSDDKALQDYELCIHQLDLIKKVTCTPLVCSILKCSFYSRTLVV